MRFLKTWIPTLLGAGLLASSILPASAQTANPPAGANAKPVKIGYLMPFSGTEAQNGKDNQDGFNLYLASIDNMVAGRRIEVLFADTEGKPDTALAKAKQFVQIDKVDLLMGISLTPECYAIAPYVREAKVPVAVSGNCGGFGLTTNPKYKSDYMVRFTQTSAQLVDPIVAYAIKQGLKRITLVTSDYGGGLQVGDFFGVAFVGQGGQIVQELHPPLGTADFGPTLSQLTKDSDAVAVFLPGADGLKFADQYRNYVGNTTQAILDIGANMVAGPNLAQLKDKALGFIGSGYYTLAADTPVNHAFLKVFREKYPGRLVSPDAAQGYSAAMILEAALKKVNGNVENTPAFLEALYGTNVQTAKGLIKLDANHDVIETGYVFQIVKDGDGYTHKLIDTLNDIGQYGSASEAQGAKFGTLKGTWVGMTKDRLATVLAN
jgi:branched-chain amino acid transport system substrate-binding protein